MDDNVSTCLAPVTAPDSPTPATGKRIWNSQQERVLKSWAEICNCLRWMYADAHDMYRKLNNNVTIPVIILSTLTGTANFAQSMFPVSMQHYVPIIIGSINLIAAIISTISQFLGIAKLHEQYRVATNAFSKFSRGIKVELSLPVDQRADHGHVFLRASRIEFDRLLEQAPPLPKNSISRFNTLFADDISAKRYTIPDLLHIEPVDVYVSDSAQRTATLVAQAATLFQKRATVRQAEQDDEDEKTPR